MLERFGTLSQELDEYPALLREGSEGRPLALERKELGEDRGQGQEEGKDGGQVKTGPEQAGESAGPQKGKLTREAGMANREKGNCAQLQFSETVLRSAGRLHGCSLKEGEPDFLFYTLDNGRPKSLGAFKAPILSEDGTKQRWIPGRKMLAEVKAAAKLSLPLILFVLDLANGRIWAKVIATEEVKRFAGITAPLMLVENDPPSEKACRETLDMALQLL